MKHAILAVLIIALSGCTSVGYKFAGLCQIQESVETFDDANTVTFTKCFSPTGFTMSDVPIFKYGFIWSSNRPEDIIMTLHFDSSVHSKAYTSFEYVAVNMDGRQYRYPARRFTNLTDSGYNNVSNTIYTSSTSSVTIPFEIFEKMNELEDVRLRISSSDYIDDMFYSYKEYGLTKYTRLYMDDYLAAINKYR
ncbi:hypothetical protein ACFO4O_04185 [Glaciecola siphonariae]|uniref:Lipoprotein n=1 Tax=Glaciecola siphonariae TaxID=521012 RepID=A0ABV9LS77_9ALTE